MALDSSIQGRTPRCAHNESAEDHPENAWSLLILCGLPLGAQAQDAWVSQQNPLTMDVHANRIIVVRLVKGAKPQPPQTMKSAVFPEVARKQPQRRQRNCLNRP
jgi:hypothetical protein